VGDTACKETTKSQRVDLAVGGSACRARKRFTCTVVDVLVVEKDDHAT
jgi:hypothetical protein